MTERIKGSDSIVRHRGKGHWSRVKDKDAYEETMKRIRKHEEKLRKLEEEKK